MPTAAQILKRFKADFLKLSTADQRRIVKQLKCDRELPLFQMIADAKQLVAEALQIAKRGTSI